MLLLSMTAEGPPSPVLGPRVAWKVTVLLLPACCVQLAKAGQDLSKCWGCFPP